MWLLLIQAKYFPSLFLSSQASVLVEDTKQYDVLESKKTAAKKLKNFEHQRELQAQILEKERRAKEVDMSLAEEQMNKDLLVHVHKVLQEHKSEVSAAKWG